MELHDYIIFFKCVIYKDRPCESTETHKLKINQKSTHTVLGSSIIVVHKLLWLAKALKELRGLLLIRHYTLIMKGDFS